MYMTVLPACTCVHIYAWSSQRPEDGIGSPGTGVTNRVAVWCVFWEPKSCPLKKYHLIFTAEPSSPAPGFLFCLKENLEGIQDPTSTQQWACLVSIYQPMSDLSPSQTYPGTAATHNQYFPTSHLVIRKCYWMQECSQLLQVRFLLPPRGPCVCVHTCCAGCTWRP